MPMTFLGPAPQSCWDELRALATDLHAAAIATSLASRATDIPAEYGLGCVFSTQSYGLRNVRLDQPTLVLVLEGTKRYGVQGASPSPEGAHNALAFAPAPALLLFPADISWHIENIPASHSSQYLAFFLAFAPALLERTAQSGPVSSSLSEGGAFWPPPGTSGGEAAPCPVATLPLADTTLLSALRLLLLTVLEQSKGSPRCPQLIHLQCEQLALLLA